MPKDTCKSTKSIALLFDISVITLRAALLCVRFYLAIRVCICMRACCCGTAFTLNFEEFSPQQSRVSGKKKEVKKQSNHMTCERKKKRSVCGVRSTRHTLILSRYRDARGQQMVRKKSAPIRSRAFLFAATDGETRNREDDDDAGKKNEIEELSE